MQPHLLATHRDDVAPAQLATTAGLDPAADRDDAFGEQRADVGAGVDEAGELEQLPEADAVVPYRHLAHPWHGTAPTPAPCAVRLVAGATRALLGHR